ncbi:uncharacterized protein TNIN_81251 [Trichonephila inaurata madagascariensis]|uniref:Retroviral polymerase SH3-like domain-containing protein n=1 Tax=Trichonephila inaurata madagascariensis TaxID=2747483 RepID=A0A8X7BRK3_9ARAC|nr:uncharacterized protein TNIN_490961 [Trichonephila inaurata madagascariensis]GFY75639.1 uncharacterized protein TNIN_81251 [Trichonephila inaurata madagascariensis]
MDFSCHIKSLTGETDWPMWKRKIHNLLEYHEGRIKVKDGKLKMPESIDADAQETLGSRRGCLYTHCKTKKSLWNELNNGLEARGNRSPCYAHVPAQKRKKMDKAIQGYLVGNNGREQHRIWLKKEHRVILSRDVIFQEKADRQLRNPSLLQKPKRFEDHIMEAETFLDDYNSESYEEAVNSKDSTNWKKAMESEMNSLSENPT